MSENAHIPGAVKRKKGGEKDDGILMGSPEMKNCGRRKI